MNLFGTTGKERRDWRDDKLRTLADAFTSMLGPTGIPERVGAVNEMFNPMVGMSDAMAYGGQVANPDLTPAERAQAALRSGTEIAGVVAPAAATRFAPGVGGLTEPKVSSALADSLVGVDLAPAALPNPVQRNVPALPPPGPNAFPDPYVRMPNGNLEAVDPQPVLRQSPSTLVAPPPDVIPLSGTKHPMAPRDPETGILYSEALQQALNLQQKKGTVTQFRKALEKAGVKPEELEFRGFDLAFKDPNAKVTRDEIIDFFQRADGDVVTSRKFQAEGTTGGEPPDRWDMERQFIDQNLDYETDYYLSEYMPDSVASDPQAYDLVELGDVDFDQFDPEDPLQQAVIEAVQSGQDLSPEDAFAYAKNAYEQGLEYIHMRDGDVYSDAYQFAEQNLEDQAREYAEEALNERLNYEFRDDQDLMEELGMGSASTLDTRDTTYSDYMVPGITDYFENVRMTDLPETVPPRAGYEGGHSFDDPVQDQAFWARGGFVPQFPGGPPNVRAIMEIQSDLSQRSQPPGSKPGSKPTRRTLAEDIAYAQLADEKAQAVSDARYARNNVDRVGGRLRHGNAGMIRPASGGEAIRDALTDPDLPFSYGVEAREPFLFPEGAPVEAYRPAGDRRGTGLDYSWRGPMRLGQFDHPTERQLSFGLDLQDPANPSMFNFFDRMREAGQAPDPTTEAIAAGEIALPSSSSTQLAAGPSTTATDVGRLPNVSSYPNNTFREAPNEVARVERRAAVPGSPEQPVLPLGFTPEQEQFRTLADELAFAQGRVDAAEEALRPMADTEASAPFQKRDVGPVRAALSRELANAVDAGDKAMVTGSGELAGNFTMLPESKWYVYDKSTPKELQKILDKAAPGTKVEPIKVQIGTDREDPNSVETVTLMGVRLTDEVRKAIKYNGIPYFSLGGGMVALGVPGMAPQEDQDGS